MVERIILLKLHDPDTRAQVAALTQAALSRLASVDRLSVGLPAEASTERSWDVSVVIAVANLALMTALLDSEPFRTWLEQAMKDRYVVIKAWNFETLPA